jgi:RNA polymerase sigma-70 factor (ECF subfamily)
VDRSTLPYSPPPLPPCPATPQDTPGAPAGAADRLPRVAAHDLPAFTALYAQYGRRLQHYLKRVLGDPALAEDVCHDVWLVVWQHGIHCPAPVPLFAWLCGMARHKARKAAVQRARGARTPAVFPDRRPATPEDILLHQEAGAILARTLDTLPFYERTALGLLVQQGCSYKDIAAVMGTPVNTVRTRIRRACHRLRTRVGAGGSPRATLPTHPTGAGRGYRGALRRQGARIPLGDERPPIQRCRIVGFDS